MSSSIFDFDVAVVGIGRVGLPLALLFASKGLRVLGVDRDRTILDPVNSGRMPFKEEGFQELLDRGCAIETSDRIADCARAEKIIITVGTPFSEHIEMNLGHVNEVLKAMIPVLVPGQSIILRSTVAVGTTEFVRHRIEVERGWQLGREFLLTFAPERILEGKALEELSRLPQPIGAEDDESFQSARVLFTRLTAKTFHVSFRGAELVKLFCNTGRYVYFALVNYFFMVANEFGEDIYRLLEVTNEDYPRPILFTPGFTGGPCLRKDFAMISELFPQSDLFTSAWRINESLPKAIVDQIGERVRITNKRVAVLGFTFKRDSDDIRDSLIQKLLRYLLREVPRQIRVSEPNLPASTMLDCGFERFANLDPKAAVVGADVVILAMNHSTFIDQWPELMQGLRHGVLVVDVWNACGKGEMFYYST
ncbi:nucleotide sugar dehydrogenase [Magnetovirga frankeli]|uniref:nucleotide sugar dehydrogenase n=1 Tax=Magnetovirga frankeli TaxID=947516 RepID=UPI001293B3B4|nr:nucleotide sugar dehydrogenase [gamma proteobacterium SS-5]